LSRIEVFLVCITHSYQAAIVNIVKSDYRRQYDKVKDVISWR